MKPTLQPARVPLGKVKPDGSVEITRAWYQYFNENTDTSTASQVQIEQIQNDLLYASKSASFFSRSTAQLASAAGFIPDEVTSIRVQCNAAGFDGGAATYSRVTSTTLNDYGFSDETAALLAFSDGAGGYWMLDEPAPKLAMIGCFPQALGVDPSITEDDSCTAHINALAEYLYHVQDGGVIGYDNGNYYLHETPTLYPGVGISGPPVLAREARALDELSTVSEVNWVPGLVLGDGVSIEARDNFTAPVLCVKRAGITIHTDLEGALDLQQSFSGTGVTKRPSGSGINYTARNVTIGQFVAYGFAWGLDAYKMHGIRVGDAYGDCTTLVIVRDSGETGVIGESGIVKRKPALTNNDAIVPQTVAVVGLFDSGGQVGLTLDEDVEALGLETNARVGNNKLPTAINNNRYTVTVLSPTTIQLEGTTWDPAYSTFTLTDRSTISFQPHCSSAVTAFYDAGGYIGVQCALPFPFRVGHLALLGANDLACSGMHNVLTVVSDTDFVLDKAWDAGLATTDVTTCEFGAMPNARYHSEVISYWGTNEGYGAAAVNSDGIRINFANKGGSGYYCDAASAHIDGSNEGPQVGELDYGPTDTTGIRITQPRTRFTGDFKSCGLGIDIDLEGADDAVTGMGIQATDGGRASLRLRKGQATLMGFRVKGLGRILLDDIAGLDILNGNVTPTSFAGNAAVDIRRTATRWRESADWSVVNQIAGSWRFYAWDSSGTAVEVFTAADDGVTFNVPVALPPMIFESTGATAGGGAVTMTDATNGAQVILTANTAAILLDATTVENGFRFTVRTYRPAGDWTIPTTTWGTGVVLRFNRGAAHTKLLDKGEATFTVEDVGGTRYLTVRGDTA